MKWKAEKWLFLMVFSYLKNNKNSWSYRCSNIAKNRVFCTFRLGLLENLTWWSNSEPEFGFYAKNYFGNDYRYLYNNHNLIFCRPVLFIQNFSFNECFLEFNWYKWYSLIGGNLCELRNAIIDVGKVLNFKPRCEPFIRGWSFGCQRRFKLIRCSLSDVNRIFC